MKAKQTNKLESTLLLISAIGRYTFYYCTLIFFKCYVFIACNREERISLDTVTNKPIGLGDT